MCFLLLSLSVCVDRMLPEVGRIPFYWPVQGQGRGCVLGLGLSQRDMKTTDEPHSRYDLDDMDVSWLELVNQEFRELGERLLRSPNPAPFRVALLLSRVHRALVKCSALCKGIGFHLE